MGSWVIIGGDCTITLGVVAGSGPDVRLVYEDGDMDLGGLGNADSPESGILDSTGTVPACAIGAVAAEP